MNAFHSKTITLIILGICLALPFSLYSSNQPLTNLTKEVENVLSQTKDNVDPLFSTNQIVFNEDDFSFESGLYKTLDGNWGLDNKEKETYEVHYKGLNDYKQLFNICSELEKKYNKKSIHYFSALPLQQIFLKELYLLNRTFII